MIALLSVAPPPSPRAIQARNAFSRRSRRAEYCRNGSMLERESGTKCPSLRPRSFASPRAGAPPHETRQPRQVLLALERERIGLLVGQHVLAERGAQTREPLVDGG